MNQFIAIFVTVFLAIINIAIVIAIKFNDLKHIDIRLNSIEKKTSRLIERVSKIEGILSVKKR